MTHLMPNQTANVVRERDRRRLRHMAQLLVVGCVVVAGVLGYVWLHVQGLRLSYEIEDLRSLKSGLDAQNKRLRIEVLTLGSFGRVEAAARRLGLVIPAPDQVRAAREFAAGDPERAAVRTATAPVAASPRGRP